MTYRVLDHTADFMIEVWAGSLKELFEEAAKALFAEVLTDLKTVRPSTCRKISLSAADRDELLVAWLGELLFLHESEGWLFSRFTVTRLAERELEGEAWGERFERSRHTIEREVKAVTYHRLGIAKEGGSFRTRIVFDL